MHKTVNRNMGKIIRGEADIMATSTGASVLLKVLPETEEATRTQLAKVFVEPDYNDCRTYKQLHSSAEEF